MKCNNCGAENRNNVKYCTQCGKLIEEKNQQESNIVDTEKSFSNNITENETIQEEGLIYSCDNVNCGISSGVLKVYEDRLLFISNKGKEILYKYNDIHKVSDSLGCVAIIAIDGRTDSFAVNKNIRSKIVEYINNQQIVKENKAKVPVTNTISNEEVAQKVNELKDKTNKTINMAKDDIKNFKTISRKKQIIYVAIIFVIVILLISLFNNGSSSNSFTTKSDSFYGMRFNKTISEFCEDYNLALEETITTTTTLDTLTASKFSYTSTSSETNLKQYTVNKLNYSIILFLDSDNYIVSACVGYNLSGVADSSKFLSYISTEIYPALVMALTECSKDDVLDYIIEVSEKEKPYYKDNVCYYFITNSSNNNISYLYATACSKNKYEKYIK